jgi:hypothetical protein
MAAIELYSTPLYSDANLVAYYRLENTADSKGSYTLTNNNSVTFVAGEFNNAAAFTGNTQSLANTSVPLTTSNAGVYSFTLWIKVTTAPSNSQQDIVSIQSSGAKLQEWRYIDSSGTKTFGVSDYNGSIGTTNTFSQTFTVGTWYLVTVNKNGTAIQVFVNGISIGTSTLTLSDGNGVSNLGVTLGHSPNTGTTVSFPGVIDDCAFFNRILTATEISNLYNGTWSTTSVLKVSGIPIASISKISGVTNANIAKISGVVN